MTIALSDRDKALIAGLLLVAAVAGIVGCQTTSTLPDGTIVVSTTDWNKVFETAEQLYAFYEQIQERRDAAREVGDAEREARLNERIQAIREIIGELR